MPSHRWREALSPSSSRAVLAHAPQRKSVDLPDISAMLMDRTVMKQQWIESEQLLFSLVIFCLFWHKKTHAELDATKYRLYIFL